MQIQTQVEGLIPRIQSLAYENLQITAQIAELEKALAEVPVVVKMNADIARLKRQYEVNTEAEQAFREEGKDMMISSGIKDFTMLDGTTIALHITP
jgi:methylaspartate ammonia-lyase